ncbi:MAG: hypothetical protein LBT51_02640 [Fusobacteriaceae bacterium]|jgi:hypothetical protein|nr:hypothetical protein [Fusobacteriaceae bacterium]
MNGISVILLCNKDDNFLPKVVCDWLIFKPMLRSSLMIYKLYYTILYYTRFVKIKCFINFFYNIPYKAIEQADLIICHEWAMDLFMCVYIKRCYPDKRFVIWSWNKKDEKTYQYYKQSGWQVWSFDETECKKYELNYNKTFMVCAYVPLLMSESTEIYYDVYFCGHDKGRLLSILKVKEWLENLSISNHICIVDERHGKEEISYSVILSELQKANAILDIPLKGQYGITQREMEALFFKKKLITTNPMVKKRDYYHPDNIYVIDFSEPPEKIIEFLQKPIVSIEKDILVSYSLSAWIQRFVTNNKF